MGLVDGEHVFVLKEARHYEKLPNRKIQCKLCPKECTVDDIERGFCGTRENRGGTYYVLTYGNPCATHIDPIEKKPFFHFLPGTKALSISTAGCNLACKFCQNWQLSQFRPEQTDNVYLPPEKLVGIARREKCPSIAYTYGEPVVFYEYMCDTAVEGHRYGIRSVVITGGYITPEPLRKLCKVVDAIKVDLKAFTEKYYREVCSGELEPVLKGLEVLRDEGIWYEIVYLVVPTLNDSMDEIRAMSQWIREALGPDVPVHFSRFYPQYMLKNLPATPVSTLEKARKVAMDAGLNFVYIGNVPGHEGENTYCPKCGKVVIRRVGYYVLEINLKKGKCAFCGQPIPGVWS